MLTENLGKAKSHLNTELFKDIRTEMISRLGGVQVETREELRDKIL